MKEKRLLERIAALQIDSQRSHQTQAQLLLESLMEHLRRILNTRQGSVPMDPDFGVPDFTNIAGSFASGETTQIIESMTRMIARYEPRLKAPRITIAENGREVLSLSFMLDGLVAVDDKEIPVHLSTLVSSDGRVSLSMR